jgi:2,3-bisphosphoglycerate-independent phosphoglycerate mutase
MLMRKNIVLCILDGWGIGSPEKDNAIDNANPEFYNQLLKKHPNSILNTSGHSVGLPEGQMGNSEVGHMTIGSGRVIEQDLVKINNLITRERFFEEVHFSKLLSNFDNDKNRCHLVGLVSDGGVHSHMNHLLTISKHLNGKQIKTFIHIITDGRDTLPKSGINFVKKTQDFIEKTPYVSIATISGRYYAMDRDARYTRTELSYNTIINGNNKTFADPIEAIESSYSQNITDEFIIPQSTNNYDGAVNGDLFIFTNFRADRMRQLVSSLVVPEFSYFNKKNLALTVATMTSYSTEIDKYVSVLLRNEEIRNTLAEILEQHSMTQLRIAETEKYAHVTFFFNAGKEVLYNNEKRILIDSPKVATYDIKTRNVCI